MRWLNETDPRKDVVNAKYHCLLQLTIMNKIEQGKSPNILEFALRNSGIPASIVFLKEDESYIVCGIECGLHGDRGPNGARGTSRNLAKLGRAVNKGHDHTASIRDGVYSAGACSTKFNYSHGPTSVSISHIVTFENGSRQIITMWQGKWRAE
jgi:hypothetical protein